MYKVQFYSYCGMSGLPHSFEDSSEARQYAAQRITSLRKLTNVITIIPGTMWEALEPEGCQMVPDFAGTLELKHITFKCRECDCQHETQDEAYACCIGHDDPEYQRTEAEEYGGNGEDAGLD